MSAPIIRRALSSDASALLSLYAGLAGERRSAQPGGLDGSQRLLEEILADPLRLVLVADIEGQAVGTADMLIVKNLTHHGMAWAIVENVVVAEQYRRRGIARSLFDHLIDVARAAGCYKLELLSAKHRAGAHAFYASIGLEAVSEGFKIYFDD